MWRFFWNVNYYRITNKKLRRSSNSTKFDEKSDKMTLFDEKSDKKKQKCSRKIIVFEAEWDFSLFIPGKNSKCSTNLAQICRTFSVNIENFVEQFEKCSPWGTFCRIFPNFVKLFLTVNILKNVLQKNVHKKGKNGKNVLKNVLQTVEHFQKC